MKRILMGGIAVGLCSSVVLTGNVAQAIPDAQILTKLQSVPVFALTDKNGAPLLDNDGRKSSYTGAYFHPQDAQAALQRIGRDKPELVKQLQIRPVALSEVYKLQASKKAEVLFVPHQSDVATALTLAQRTNRSLKKFEGVPLFLGLAGKQPGYLTISQNKRQVIPLFFDREQLQPYLDTFKKNNPTLAATAGVQVLSLETFLATLRTNNNPLYDKVVMMPSPAASESVRKSKAVAR
jgi:Tic22-like family